MATTTCLNRVCVSGWVETAIAPLLLPLRTQAFALAEVVADSVDFGIDGL